MAVRCFMRYIIFASYLVAGQSPQYGGQGLETVLSPNIPGPPENILWKHKGNKVVEFDGREQRVYDTYENRVIVDWTTAELTIKDLRHEDSGPYVLEVIFKSMLHHSNHRVEVIDAVAEPTVSCAINDTSSSDTSAIQATLVCSAEPRGPPSLLRFEWRSLERVQPGPGLSIPLGSGHDDAEYTCRVSNPVSEKTATFSAKDCYSDKSTLIAAIVCTVILCIIVLLAVGFCYYKKRSKAGAVQMINDEEKQSLHCTTKEHGGSAHGQAAMSTSQIPAKENGGSADRQAAMSPNECPGKGSEEKPDEDQDKEPLLPVNNGATLPSTQPLAFYAPNGQNMELEDTTSEREEDADSDQVTGEPAEKKLPETDSSGVEEEKNELDSTDESEDPREEKESNLLSPHSPTQPSLDPTLPELESSTQEQTNAQADTTEDNQREMDTPASEQDNGTVNSSEKIDETSNLSPDSPQQPQSSTPTTPDNTKPFQDQPGIQEPSSKNHLDLKVTHPEQESKPIYDQEHSQTDLYTPESVQDESQHEVQTPDKKNEARSGPNGEEPGVCNSPTGQGEEIEDYGAEDTGMEIRAENDLGLDVDQPADTEKASSEIQNIIVAEEETDSESEVGNLTEQEPEEEEKEPGGKGVTSESGMSGGAGLKDKTNEDQDLNKEVPLPQTSMERWTVGKNEDVKTNAEALHDSHLAEARHEAETELNYREH